MDLRRFAAQVALIVSMIALAFALSGCGPKIEDFNQPCMDQANLALLEPYYQPGGRGFMFRDSRHQEAFNTCRQVKMMRARWAHNDRMAPLVAGALSAGSAAIWQANPRVLLYP